MSWIFLTNNTIWEFNAIIYRYTKPDKWIQILTKLSALFIVLLVGVMAFCASWQLPKFLFQGSDSEFKVMLKVLFVMQTRNLFFMKFFSESADCQQAVAQLEVWARKENVAERGPLATVGESLTTLRKKWEIVVNPDVDGCTTKTLFHRKILQKTQQKYWKPKEY